MINAPGDPEPTKIFDEMSCVVRTRNSPQNGFHKASTDAFQILLRQGLNKYAKTKNNKQNDEDVFPLASHPD